MPTELLDTKAAARVLGIGVTTLYDWLSQSDGGNFRIRGQHVTIKYYQGGPRGQGRIRIAEMEVERLLGLTSVTPKAVRRSQPVTKDPKYRFITVELGRPED